MGTERNGCPTAGLKQEVATALRTLRDELLEEQKEKEVKGEKRGTRTKQIKKSEVDAGLEEKGLRRFKKS